MTVTPHPIRALGHSHGRLNALVTQIAQLIRGGNAEASARVREKVRALSAELREELLEHFAKEEEGLFPFVRTHLPGRTETVDRLEAAHDSICGSMLRIAHLTAKERHASTDVLLVFERFERAYAAHSRDEAELLDELGGVLTPTQQGELAEHLRGL